MTRRHADNARSGFTLIEVLVVILIISILVSLTAVMLSKVRDKAKAATVQAEMAQLGNAIGAFKTKLNASFLPAFEPTTGSLGFQLASNYIDKNGTLISATASEATYLKQLFPQMSLSDNGLRDSNGKFIANGNATVPSGLSSIQGPIPLDPNQSMLFFLTGSTFTNFQGFSTNRVAPFSSPSGGTSVGPFFEVKAGQLSVPPNTTSAASAAFPSANPPWYTDAWGNPYAYFAFDPTMLGYPGTAWPTNTTAGTDGVTALAPTINSAQPGGVTPYFDQAGKVVQLKGFQIVSAGKDGQFGAGGKRWVVGQGDYTLNFRGSDDLASFNSTPLGSQD